jgi:hypothetical protein
MLSVLGYGSILFIVELVFLVITTTSIDMNKPMSIGDVFGSLAKFYILNIVFVAILTYFPS